MSNTSQDWEAFGRNIQEIVERAVNSQNYQKLNQTVNRAVKVGGETLRKAAETAARSGTVSHTARPAANAANAAQPAQPTQPALYDRTAGRTISGVLKTVFGSLFALGGGITLLVLSAIAFWSGKALALVPACIMGGGIVVGLGLLGSGVQRLGSLSRFRQYVKFLGAQTHCSIELLARRVGKSAKFVRRDLRKMISEGLFFEGHLDAEGTTLITSNETYRHYEENRKLLAQKQAEAQNREAEMASRPQLQELLRRGNDFLREIRDCNDAIPGEEISGKISQMESIVSSIFERAERHPEVIPDLKKLMDYYLPITVKLLHAYADMDRQSVAGENIVSSKREIEATIDTLNTAYEKLLDSVFKDTAMDVSSDISVLNSLLAQEGLTDDGFLKKNS